MAHTTIQQIFDQAVQHHQAGRLNEAERLYRQILARQPKHAGALHYLGMIAHRMGQPDAAIDLIRQALAIMPNWPEAYSNLGSLLQAKGQTDQAIAAYRQAIALNPGYPEVYYNLGTALQATGHLDQAMAAWQRAITLRPTFPEAHYNLGNALMEQNQPDQAIAAYRQAVALRPHYPQALGNLGNALRLKDRLHEAIAAHRQSLALNPHDPEVHCNLGHVLQDQGSLAEAIAAYRQAIALKPNYPEAYNNLGNALRNQGHPDEAIAACRQAVALQPDYVEAHSNLGAALQAKGLVDDAMAAYHHALALKPDYAEAHYNRGTALLEKESLDQAVAAYRQAIALKPDYPQAYNNLGNILKDTGQWDEAIAAYRQAIAYKPSDVGAHSNLVYGTYFHPGFDAKAIAQEHRRWNQRHAEPLHKYIQPHTNDRNPGRRLRIGYVSPDFRQHVVGQFLLPLLAYHDHQSFEIFAYSQVMSPDAMTQRLGTYCNAWRNLLGQSDAQAADLVRQDRIDILVDLTLHMANHRLLVFARKPAPVQVTYLAYAGTSGLTAMDYRLSDPYLDPPGMDESIYSEQTVRLPETYWCYRPAVHLPLQPPPSLEKGFVTFGCLNNYSKVNEPLLSLWGRLLAAVPHSRLLLHTHEGSHRQRILDCLQPHGIDPARISFAGKLPTEEYFQQYQAIDIALDTHPYGGGTTTCDALGMGVPVVSLRGNTAVGRGGLSILSNLGLPELVGTTPEEYVRLAAELANDLPRLRQQRATLRQRMEASPLMDAARFARNVEAAYRQMWRKWCAA